MSLTEWLNEATPERRSVPVCWDRDLVVSHDEAEKKLRRLEGEARVGEDALTLSDPQIDQARAKVEELAERMKERSHTLVFQSIGRRAWRTLVGEHPPTEEQKEEHPDWEMNPETFIPAALAASCSEPGMSLAEAHRLMDESPTETMFQKIWVTCLTANVAGTKDPPFLMASDGTRLVART